MNDTREKILSDELEHDIDYYRSAIDETPNEKDKAFYAGSLSFAIRIQRTLRHIKEFANER